jgi:peroxiredoxin
MLDLGTIIAPDLALVDHTGAEVTLAGYLANGPVLLYFMRTSTCPVCANHVRDLARRKAEFDAKGVQVVVAVPEGPDEAAAAHAALKLPYPVVTGRSGTAHEAFGLTARMFGSMQQSGSVLLDGDGRIRHAHSATVPVGAYDRAGLGAALQAMPGTRSAA